VAKCIGTDGLRSGDIRDRFVVRVGCSSHGVLVNICVILVEWVGVGGWIVRESHVVAVLLGLVLLTHLPLPLGASVLEPGLHLLLAESQFLGQLQSLWHGQVALLGEVVFQCSHLLHGEDSARLAQLPQRSVQ